MKVTKVYKGHYEVAKGDITYAIIFTESDEPCNEKWNIYIVREGRHDWTGCGSTKRQCVNAVKNVNH